MARTLQLERIGDTAVLNLRKGLLELEFEGPHTDAGQVLDLVGDVEIRNVIVDCHDTDFLRSTALGFFVRVWKRIRDKGGHMAFCNATPKVRQILELTKLDQIWSVCGSRAEAIAEVER